VVTASDWIGVLGGIAGVFGGALSLVVAWYTFWSKQVTVSATIQKVTHERAKVTLPVIVVFIVNRMDVPVMVDGLTVVTPTTGVQRIDSFRLDLPKQCDAQNSIVLHVHYTLPGSRLWDGSYMPHQLRVHLSNGKIISTSFSYAGTEDVAALLEYDYPLIDS
jgi:hypothetical protein